MGLLPARAGQVRLAGEDIAARSPDERARSGIKEQKAVSILLVEQYLEFAWRPADFYYIMERGPSWPTAPRRS